MTKSDEIGPISDVLRGREWFYAVRLCDEDKEQLDRIEAKLDELITAAKEGR